MRSRQLLTQVLIVNVALVAAAVVAATLVADEGLDESGTLLVLGLVLTATVIVNAVLLQGRFRPLERLVDEMERADLSRPGANLRRPDGPALRRPVPGDPGEVERLQRAFRRMLERLEAERRRASRAALTAQEEERARVARDLHDEVNQSLTGLLLRLEAARDKAPPELAGELAETKALANQAMQELLALARQLRPAALDDHGLKAALAGHLDELGRQSGIATSIETEGDLSTVPPDVQLVVYRVAQEALSNAARHSGADSIRVRLAHEDDEIELTVADDGRGFSFDQANRGLGVGGMRERALLVGGRLDVESRPELGTRIRLRVPIGEPAARPERVGAGRGDDGGRGTAVRGTDGGRE
jgi:two-component system, NarL family, sensor histidine kinase UhpB